MTNYEAIKAMDMHGLAGFLASITTCGDCPAFGDCDGHGVCTEVMLEWLTGECTEVMLEWLTYELVDLAKGGNEMENRTIEFQGKGIDVDDEPGETSDMIHHPDHYTWKGTECKKVIELMTRGLSGVEAYYMGNIIKYMYRYPKKGTLETDLAKAAQYMEFLKEHFAKKEESGHAE